jgi:hypothetical protein
LQASNAEEIDQLTQGFGEQQGTNTMFFIPHTSIPKNKKPTYLQVVFAYRPEKANSCCICWKVGRDCIYFAADVSTKAADLTTAKILLNSVISTPGARFLGIDIKDFYLSTVMTQYEYMCIPLQMLPPAIKEQYNLTSLIHNSCVYVEIRKGMYGLPQAGKLANSGAIHVYCCVMKEVLSSAAKAELGALFHNSKEACPLQTALIKMGHPQNPTTLFTNNSTAARISNSTVKQRRSKAINIQYYWHAIAFPKDSSPWYGRKEKAT